MGRFAGTVFWFLAGYGAATIVLDLVKWAVR